MSTVNIIIIINIIVYESAKDCVWSIYDSHDKYLKNLSTVGIIVFAADSDVVCVQYTIEYVIDITLSTGTVKKYGEIV